MTYTSYDKAEAERITHAVSEARRFLHHAEVMLGAHERQEDLWRRKDRASMKRASLDLSNALVAIRKSPYS